MEVHVSITHSPVGKGRARVVSKGGRIWAYTPEKTANAEAFYRMSVQAQLPGDWRPLEGAIAVDVVFYRSMPKGVPKRLRETARPTQKPDLDNYEKCFDAFQGLLWKDDSQIVMKRSEKAYAQEGTEPRIEVSVKEYL